MTPMTLTLIYIWISLVSALAVFDLKSVVDNGLSAEMFASAVVGLIWPIYIPARIIRKLID